MHAGGPRFGHCIVSRTLLGTSPDQCKQGSPRALLSETKNENQTTFLRTGISKDWSICMVYAGPGVNAQHCMASQAFPGISLVAPSTSEEAPHEKSKVKQTKRTELK